MSSQRPPSFQPVKTSSLYVSSLADYLAPFVEPSKTFVRPPVSEPRTKVMVENGGIRKTKFSKPYCFVAYYVLIVQDYMTSAV